MRVPELLLCLCCSTNPTTTYESLQGFYLNFYKIGLTLLSFALPDTAGWLNAIYFGHYLIGRMVSIPLSTLISPSVIIFVTLLGCLLSTIILVSFGIYQSYALFIATGLMGLSVSPIFPSGITLLSSNINISSTHVSFVFLGSNLANCVFPPLASKLFNNLGPIYVFYMTLICLIMTFICFFLMIMVIHKTKSPPKTPSTSV